jgi:hypothetical protein
MAQARRCRGLDHTDPAVGRRLRWRQRGAIGPIAMTVSPDAGISGPDTFRDEGLYAFRFDLNGDAKEELAFIIVDFCSKSQ